MQIDKNNEFIPENKGVLGFHSFKKLEKVDKIDSSLIHIISSNKQDKHLLPPLADCLMSEQEIDEFSVLDEIDNKAILTKETVSDRRLLKVGANILGGGLITGEELKLEGSNPCEIYGVFESILLDMKESSEDKELDKILNPLIASTHELVEIAKDVICFSQSPPSESNPTKEEIEKERMKDQSQVQELVKKYAQRINDLKKGESFNMHGGWCDIEGGHAQIYEIVGEGDDLYSFNFYTSTYDPKIGIWKNTNKAKIQPIVRYRNIPKKYLLLGDETTSAVFIQNLLELQLSYKGNYSLKIDTDLVNHVFLYLLPYHMETSIKESGVVLGQRSGTCVPSVWKVFARIKCKDLNVYKQLIFQVKFSFLTHFFKRLEGDLGLATEDGKNKRRALKYVTRNFLRSIAKMEGSEVFLKEAQANCLDILKRIEKAENNIKEYQKNNVLESDLKSNNLSKSILEDQEEAVNAREIKISNFKVRSPLVKSEPKGWRFPVFLKAPIDSFDQFCKRVKEIQELFWDTNRDVPIEKKKLTKPWKYWASCSPMSEFLPTLELQDFIEALPIPSSNKSDFWAQLKAQEALECMKSLESLLYMYNLVDQQPLLRQQTAYVTLYAIMHRLALIVEISGTLKDKATIAHYKMNNYALELLKAEGALFLDFKIFSRLKEVAVYFEEFNRGKSLDEKAFSFNESGLEISNKFSSHHFWEALVKSNNTLEDIIREERDSYNQYRTQRLSFLEATILFLESGYIASYNNNILVSSLEILHKANLSYINQFRYACFLANPFVVRKDQSNIGGPYKSQGGIALMDQVVIVKRQSAKENLTIENDGHRDIGQYSQLLKEKKFSRYASKFASGLEKEANVLDKSRKEDYQIEKTSLLRIAETWELTPDQLLFYFESDMSLLNEPERQSLFFRLFFRSVVLGEKIESVCLGAGELLCKEKSLRENTLFFIQKGLSYFFESKDYESFQGQRFFLELSFYCEKYLKDQGQEAESALFNQMNWINERLKEKLFIENAAILHRARLLFYSLQDCKNLTTDEVAAIFISHIEVTFHPDTKNWTSLFLDDVISNFVSKALSQVQNREDLGQIGTKILFALQLIDQNTALKCHSFSDCLLKLSNNYIIDLKMGQIYDPNNDLISRLSLFKILRYWEQFKHKIFSSKDELEVRACSFPVGEDAFLFKDPLIENQFLVDQSTVSQQFEPDGPFYEYKEKLHFCVEPALLKRHNYWWNPKTSEGYLVDKTNNQRKFCVTPKGRIISFENQEIEAGGLSLFKDEKFINLEKAKAFSNFTEGKDVLILSKNEQIQEVHFTNFLSQSGSPLKFIEKHGKMVWSEQEEYFIATQTPQGLLASTSEYLYLESVNPKSMPKILVPYKKMDDAKGRDSFWDIKFCSYFVYDIIEDEIVSTSLESNLHLAHIYAQQKEYGKAMRLLRSIKPVAKFSKRAQEILYSISNMKLQEDHPDLKMVILYAVLVDLRNRQAQAKVPITDYPAFLEKEFVQYGFEFKIRYSFTEKALDYTNTRNNISQSCRLTFEEEEELLVAFPLDLLKERLEMKKNPELKERTSQELVEIKGFRCASPQQSEIPFKEILKKGEVLNSQVVRSDWKPENGLFFVKVLYIAMKGSENEKKCMLYRLIQWRYLDLREKETDPWLERMISSIVHSSDKNFFNFFDISSVEQSGDYLTEEIMRAFDSQYQRYPLTKEKILNFLTDGEVEKSIQEEFLGNFPINVQPQIYPIESKKPLEKGLGPTKELLPSTDKRWQTTAKWKEQFLSETTLYKENEKEEVEEKPFILNAIDELNKELASGETLLDKEPIYSVREDLKTLAKEAKEEQEKLDSPLEECEEAIKRLANKLPKNEEKRLREMALVGGLVKKVITIEDCLKAVLLFNHKAFKELNPHLNKKDIKNLQKLLLEREQIRSHQAQLSRIIINARNGNLNLLAQDLKAHYHFKNFSVEQQIAFHVYCGETGMIPFDTQMRVIEDMVSLSTTDVELFTQCCIKASTMGSGKSKLIAPLIFFLTSMQEGKQPLFIAPDALFEVSKSDLSHMYLKAFKRDVQAVDARRDELTLYKLKEIKKLFNACQKDKQPLIVKSVFVQTIILECRDQALKLAELIEQKAGKETIEFAKERLVVLEDLREILGKRTIPIGDEVDQLMRHNKEVNFPIGEKEKISKGLNDLVYHVYDLMRKPELEKLIKLQKNKQANLSQDDYKQKVVPKLIDALLEKEMPLSFVVNRKCCKRFLCNEIPPIVQALADDPMMEITKEHHKGYTNIEALQDDVAFLRQLSIDAKGKGTQKEQAELLCKAKELFVEILPIALKKNGNQDYGYAGEPNKEGYRKMVPYKGVNEPVSLNTEIGYYMLEVCVSYQWALSFNLSKEDLILSLKELDLAARESVKRYGISYKETPAYKTCKEFFDIELAQKDNPKALEHALDFIKERPVEKLQLMHDRINDTVSYYSEKFSCNGSNMARLFATFLGMSGTPWNAHLLLERLAYTPDLGSEGKIMQKWRKEKTPVINMKDFSSVTSFMEQCCTSEISSIIDTGAFFKNFGSNRKVAGEILNCLKEPLKVVLFFEENELYMWEKGKEPKCLGGTDNIPLDREIYFVYYDHLHITGADIYQKPNAKALMTFDKHKVTQRDFNQGGKRLRQDTQRLVVACIQEEGEKEWEFDDVLSQAAQTQKEQIKEAALIHYTQEIDSLFAHYADEKIASLTKQMKNMSDGEIAETIRKFREFLVLKTKEDPYEQHGKLKGEVNTKQMLQEYLNKKLKAYEEIEKDPLIQKALKKEAEQINSRIQFSTVLPKTILTTSNPDREQTVEVEVNTDVNKDQDVNQDTDKEQERELNLYNGIEEFKLRPESKMDEKELLEIINGKKLTPISHQLQKYKYLHPYHTLFSQDICATDNFYYSAGQILPIFHKMQKPAEEILFFNTKEGVRAVFVSEDECDAIKKILKEKYEKKDFEHVWLVQPNGTQLIENPHNPFVMEEDAIVPVLIECNVFGGHLNFLAEHAEHTHTYLLEGNEESQKLKLYFLQLRGHQKKAIFKTSLAFKTGQEEKGSSFLLQSSLEYGKNQKGKYKPKSIQEAKNCPPHRISQLHVDYVKHLKEPIQLKRLQSWQVPFVEPDYVKDLPFHLVKHLSSKEQMQALSKKQVKHISLDQAELIPHIQPAFYGEFDQMWQVQAVPVEHIDKISELHVSKCSEGQLASITVNQIPGLVSTPHLFSHIQGDLLHKIPKEYHNRITSNQIEHVTQAEVIEQLGLQDPNLINACPSPFFTSLSKEQLEKLSRPNIQKLTHEQILQIIKAGKWSDNLRDNLSKKQIHKFDTQELIDLLSTAQIADHLTEQQLQYLKTPGQINACPSGLVASLTEKQLEELSIQNLTKEQITSIAQANKWTPSLSNKLSVENQIQQFDSQILVGLLSTQQITDHIIERQLPYLTTAEQINACPEELVTALSQQQLEQLLPQNVQKLTNEEIETIAQAHKWSETLSEKLSVEDQMQQFDSQILIDLLILGQIKEYIRERQLIFLFSIDQINACPLELIPDLSQEQLGLLLPQNVQKLTNEQITTIAQAHKWSESLSEKLSLAQIQRFDSQILIDLLSVDQIKENLTQEQLPYLTALDQINACPMELVASLTRGQVQQLRPDVILEYLQEGFFPQEPRDLLSREQVIAFAETAELMPCLTPAQINAYLSPEHLTYISPEQIRGLTKKELVLSLSDEQIGLLETPEALQAVPLMRVRNFQTKDQFKKRRVIQKIGYAFAIFSMGIISTILLLVGFPTLVVPIALLVGRRRAWKVMTANTSRLTHLFRVGVLNRH